MLMSQSACFPFTEHQLKMSPKDPAAINNFCQEVQRPMLQEALVKDHGSLRVVLLHKVIWNWS